MNLLGIEAAVISFVCIGIFHPVVIKAEYYFSSRCWPAFLAAGAFCCAASLFAESPLLSVALGSLGCTCLWCIIELKEQERRVARGWFPENPKRAEDTPETLIKENEDGGPVERSQAGASGERRLG